MPTSTVRRTSARRVLVVEDDADSAEALADVLERAGYEVMVAHSANGALEAVTPARPHVVLIDVGLPGQLDGCELAVLLRAHPSTEQCRLIATTGYTGQEARQRTSAAGFDAHLTKPLDVGALLEAVAGPAHVSVPVKNNAI